MQIPIIQDNICKLIHQKCHPKSYYNGVKYHMTQNIIFSIILHTTRISAINDYAYDPKTSHKGSQCLYMF